MTGKHCGYKRFPEKEYGIEDYRCPECRSEYALVNDDHDHIPTVIPASERYTGLVLGALVLSYVSYAMF